MKNKKRERALALACCAAMAALMLLFTSQCSPLYPINVWGDAQLPADGGAGDEARRGALSGYLRAERPAAVLDSRGRGVPVGYELFRSLSDGNSRADGGALRGLPPDASARGQRVCPRRGGGLRGVGNDGRLV